MSMTMPAMIGFARASARTAIETDDYQTRHQAIAAYHQNIIDTLTDENMLQHLASALSEYYSALGREYMELISL